MARRSTRIASSQGSQQSSPPSASKSSPAAPAGRKRKAENGASPSAKRGKKTGEKQQQSIEDAMDIETGDQTSKSQEQGEHSKNENQDHEAAGEVEEHPQKEIKDKAPDGDQKEVSKMNKANGQSKDATDAAKAAEEENTENDTEVKGIEPAQSESKQDKEENQAAMLDDKSVQQKADKEAEENVEKDTENATDAPASNGDAVEPHARDGKVPSSILEKGIMYFLYRGRVNTDNPKSVQDIARSYLVLRPLPHGAKISDNGSIGDDNNCRLIAIPKKMLPLSGNDRWIGFVETANTSFKQLKENFLKANDYETQTGTRHTPAVTPAAEGVYAITSTGRESHLAYILTLPKELGDVQNDLGLRKQGSFVVSVKNPKAPGPANTNIGKDPGYPQEILNEFRALRWAPLRADMLNYEGCQFLLVGEGEQGLEKATEPQDGDEKKEETPKEEIERLEGEDEIRVEHLKGEDAIFADLGTNAEDYPSLQTTW